MSVNWIRYQLGKGCGVGLSMIIIEYVSFNLNTKKKKKKAQWECIITTLGLLIIYLDLS